MKSKGIIEYILRVIIFLILTAFLLGKICLGIITLLEHIATILYEKVPFFNGNDNAEILLSFIIAFICILISCTFATYYFAKITGIFKILDYLKKWLSFSILFLISAVIVGYIDIINKLRIINIDIICSFFVLGIFLIPSYLCYLYFKHLTKKHPAPFEKIGYYFSIEFYKNIFNKLTSGIKKRG